MLILTRTLDESIIIGSNIKVKILKVQGNQVHLGIDAPEYFSICRDEIYEEVCKENIKAVQKSIDAKVIKQLRCNFPPDSNSFSHQKRKTIFIIDDF
jgi:carbon storage regulator